MLDKEKKERTKEEAQAMKRLQRFKKNVALDAERNMMRRLVALN